MIVVLGRPAVDDRGAPSGLVARAAAAAAAAGGRVEVVGSAADEAAGDSVTLALGRAGVGHAALLRKPGTAALDAADVELGLSYIADCRVLVVAEPLAPDALRAAVEGARYHAAKLIVVGAPAAELPADATVLAPPDEDTGAFAPLLGRYAAYLDAGRGAADAWQAALAESGWESHAE